MTTTQKKILIVDDNPFKIEFLEQELADLGYATVAASNGPDGVTQAAVEEPNLILVDECMPGMDGVTVSKKLKDHARTRFIPIVLMISRDDFDIEVRSIHADADDYLPNPTKCRDLGKRIEAVLERARDTQLVPWCHPQRPRYFRPSLLG